jgi:hypothetical protein
VINTKSLGIITESFQQLADEVIVRSPWSCRCLLPGMNQTRHRQTATSAHGRADADMTVDLLDDLIRDGEQRRWHGEVERPGGLEIEDKPGFARLQDWQLGGFLTLQDADDIVRG